MEGSFWDMFARRTKEGLRSGLKGLWFALFLLLGMFSDGRAETETVDGMTWSYRVRGGRGGVELCYGLYDVNDGTSRPNLPARW